MTVNIITIDRDKIRGPGHNYVWSTIRSLKGSEWAGSGDRATLCVGSRDTKYLDGCGLDILEWDEESQKELESAKDCDPVRLALCLNYERALRHGSGGVVILEDDVNLCPDWSSRLDSAIKEIPSERYILALYSPVDLSDERLRRGDNHRSYPAADFYGTQAMYYPECVRLEIADFLHERRRSGYAADIIIKQWAVANQCLYALSGSVAEHAGNFSSIRSDFNSCIHGAWNLLCDPRDTLPTGCNKVLYMFVAHREILDAARSRVSASMDLSLIHI